LIFKDEKQNENDDGDYADRDDLSIQIRLRALQHCSGNLSHSFVTGRCTRHYRNENERENQADDGAQHRQMHSGIEQVKSKKGHGFNAIKAHDCIKISDAGKAYLPRRRNLSGATAFFRKGCGRGS
jgi:hypothetical protein